MDGVNLTRGTVDDRYDAAQRLKTGKDLLQLEDWQRPDITQDAGLTSHDDGFATSSELFGLEAFDAKLLFEAASEGRKDDVERILGKKPAKALVETKVYIVF